MTAVTRIDSPDGAQRELFDAWAGVFSDAARHLFGDAHSAWTADELRALWRHTDRRRLAWAWLEGGTVIGAVRLVMPLHDNPALASLALAVHPDHRGCGVGAALLEVAEAEARAHDRTVLWAETEWPAGRTDAASEDFAVKHGYALAQTVLRSTLSLPADRARLRSAVGGGDGYVTQSCWDGIPDHWLAGRAELSRRMSTDIPLGDLQLEAENWDADRVRDEYARIADMGRRVVSTFAVQEATGILVGYTQVQVDRDEPEVAYQQDTLVLREHRGHRLGLRMKAACTLALMQEMPQTGLVRTWNADDNTHMLAVNDELGYLRDAVLREWQKVTTEA